MLRPLTIVLSHAYRPFFLLSGVTAVAVIVVWVLLLRGTGVLLLGRNILQWHGHEMLVGFALATIAGFVLTAVATWTGRKPVNGAPLLLLVLFWIGGRIVMAVAGSLPGYVVGFVDMLFPLWLCVLTGREILAAGNRRNYPIVAITVFLAMLNLVYHLGATGLILRADWFVLYFFIHTILLLVTIIGGRILPNFTANWMRAKDLARPPSNNLLLDRLSVAATILVGVTGSLYATSAVTGWMAVGAAILHGWRLSQWRGLSTIREPLLFILHVSYLWLPIGYALLGLAILAGVGSPTGALHALTMGAIGGMILAMMTRVPLGHTGRPLHASRLTVAAYLALIVAVLLRVLSPLDAAHYLDMVGYAAIAWCTAYSLFLFVYWPILVQPRIDR